MIRTLRVVIVLHLGFYSAFVYKANLHDVLPNVAFADTQAAPPPPAGLPYPFQPPH